MLSEVHWGVKEAFTSLAPTASVDSCGTTMLVKGIKVSKCTIVAKVADGAVFCGFCIV